jgi:hypothetical protein
MPVDRDDAHSHAASGRHMNSFMRGKVIVNVEFCLITVSLPSVQACLSDFEKFKQKMADRESAMQRAANHQIAEGADKCDMLSQRMDAALLDILNLKAQVSKVHVRAQHDLSKVRGPVHLISFLYSRLQFARIGQSNYRWDT